jgi:hypothetical protein
MVTNWRGHRIEAEVFMGRLEARVYSPEGYLVAYDPGPFRTTKSALSAGRRWVAAHTPKPLRARRRPLAR